jgi:hypothetical protein
MAPKSIKTSELVEPPAKLIAIGLKMYDVHEVFDVISHFDDYLNQILSPNLYPLQKLQLN